ncbi:Signal transduction histidine-protein kinase ArlS [Enhygromyxa salina]|uniref:histidine kinase n=1 Tax=Enhygromyxa salina TaxID=215803 RepID=A0A2S9XEL0_9BACT|nr:HAMP domain-containing sensor histidine kinase [Enhygromyxa salina]PRP91308.1 Signal transduction histidine-protein kinase ArlS [Enhygromyxa salina]
MRHLLSRLFLINFSTFLVTAIAVLGVRWFVDPGVTPLDRARQAIALAVNVDAPPAQLQTRIELMRAEFGGQATVYDLEGQVLASNIAPPLPFDLDAGHSRHPSFDGAGHQNGWVVFGAVSDQVIGDTSELLLLVLGVAGIVGLGFAAWATSRLVGPLLAMTNAARSIAQGNFDVHLGLDRSDEVGVLGRAFDDMAGKLALLQRSQRELLTSVSHELRTPLARMRLAVTMLQDGDELGELLPELDTDLDELERMTDRVLGAVELDLELSHGEAMALGPRSSVPARALARRVAARFRLAHPERELDEELDEELGAVTIDTPAVLRACENLLDNAHRHSPLGRPVRLEVRRVGEWLELAVSDEGPGVPPQLRELVFTPFFRVDASRSRGTGGLGLGLTIVARIVEAHGGTVHLGAAPGAGARFSIRLPAGS